MRISRLIAYGSFALLALGTACGTAREWRSAPSAEVTRLAHVDTVAAQREVEAALFDQTNRERAANGLGPVAPDPELLEMARLRARAQSPEASLSHVDASGNLVMQDLLDRAQVSYRLAGENLARLSADRASGAEATAESADRALMQSPTHRANILEPSFDRLAVGAVTDSTGRVVIAQIFRAGAA